MFQISTFICFFQFLLYSFIYPSISLIKICSLNTCKHTDGRKRAKERFIVKNQPMGKSVDILYRDGHLTAAYREQ